VAGPEAGAPGADAFAGGLEPAALHRLDRNSPGARLTAQDPDRRSAGFPIRVARINRCNAPGTAEIGRAA
jgi:hypothetical protein